MSQLPAQAGNPLAVIIQLSKANLRAREDKDLFDEYEKRLGGELASFWYTEQTRPGIIELGISDASSLQYLPNYRRQLPHAEYSVEFVHDESPHVRLTSHLPTETGTRSGTLIIDSRSLNVNSTITVYLSPEIDKYNPLIPRTMKLSPPFDDDMHAHLIRKIELSFTGIAASGDSFASSDMITSIPLCIEMEVLKLFISKSAVKMTLWVKANEGLVAALEGIKDEMRDEKVWEETKKKWEKEIGGKKRKRDDKEKKGQKIIRLD